MPGEYSWRETGAVAITRREASTEYDPCWPGKVFCLAVQTYASYRSRNQVEVSGQNLESSQT
jgi:hypothetical protein